MISIPGAAPVVTLSLVLSGSEGAAKDLPGSALGPGVCDERSVDFMINYRVSLCAIGMTRFPLTSVTDVSKQRKVKICVIRQPASHPSLSLPAARRALRLLPVRLADSTNFTEQEEKRRG
jgi:hypothetical protein